MVVFSVLMFFLIGILYFALHVTKTKIVHHDPEVSEGGRDVIFAPAIIDSLNDITRVPTLYSGLVDKINVKIGEKVKKGEVLFSLDNSLIKTNLIINKITRDQTENELRIQKRALTHALFQLKRLRGADRRAISQAELKDKMYEVAMDRMKITQAEHGLTLATEHLKNAERVFNQYTIKSPQNGIVLQINAHLNEYVGRAEPIVLLGDEKKIIVRVSIDERDIQHYISDAPAFLTSNANRSLKIPLTFLQKNSYIVTLTRFNSTSRVQEVLYYFNRKEHLDFAAGQEFDAMIEIRKHA